MCNLLKDNIEILEYLWNNEFSKTLSIIKTPKEAGEKLKYLLLQDGILYIDEVNENALLRQIKRIPKYRYLIKSIYAQFFHQFMTTIEE